MNYKIDVKLGNNYESKYEKSNCKCNYPNL